MMEKKKKPLYFFMCVCYTRLYMLALFPDLCSQCYIVQILSE
jgi:hypothetical protein